MKTTTCTPPFLSVFSILPQSLTPLALLITIGLLFPARLEPTFRRDGVDSGFPISYDIEIDSEVYFAPLYVNCVRS